WIVGAWGTRSAAVTVGEASAPRTGARLTPSAQTSAVRSGRTFMAAPSLARGTAADHDTPLSSWPGRRFRSRRRRSRLGIVGPVTRYVALLRGIMPSNPAMANDRLRGVLQDLGTEQVSSVLASGNIVFTAPEQDVPALETRIQQALH